MKVFKIDKKQQDRIETFFSKESIFFPDHEMNNAVAIIMIAASSFVNIMPHMTYDDGELQITLLGFMLFAVGIFIYATKYAAFTEPLTKKVMNVTEITKYLPVNRMQITMFRVKKVFRICSIAACIVIALRLVISFAATGSASILDVVVPLGLMIAWPVLIEFTR